MRCRTTNDHVRKRTDGGADRTFAFRDGSFGTLSLSRVRQNDRIPTPLKCPRFDTSPNACTRVQTISGLKPANGRRSLIRGLAVNRPNRRSLPRPNNGAYTLVNSSVLRAMTMAMMIVVIACVRFSPRFIRWLPKYFHVRFNAERNYAGRERKVGRREPGGGVEGRFEIINVPHKKNPETAARVWAVHTCCVECVP